VKHPVEAVANIAVELTAHEAFLGGEHIVVEGVAGASSVKETHGAFRFDLHERYYT
jgi:hypothetical protein